MSLILRILSMWLLVGSADLYVIQEDFCGDGKVLCEGTMYECIMEDYLCDGTYADCSNAWDELDCPCDEGESKCHNSTTCIPDLWVCDGQADCFFGDDEEKCTFCQGFQCPDGRCISKERLCDGKADCAAGEDESSGCPPCLGLICQMQCIPPWRMCDKVIDCDDAQDEMNCPHSRNSRMSCGGNVLTEAQLCDAVPDCPDGSDEARCIFLRRPISAHNSWILGKKRRSQYLLDNFGLEINPVMLKL